jgi:DnaJ-class molecular chaperone
MIKCQTCGGKGTVPGSIGRPDLKCPNCKGKGEHPKPKGWVGK